LGTRIVTARQSTRGACQFSPNQAFDLLLSVGCNFPLDLHTSPAGEAGGGGEVRTALEPYSRTRFDGLRGEARSPIRRGPPLFDSRILFRVQDYCRQYGGGGPHTAVVSQAVRLLLAVRRGGCCWAVHATTPATGTGHCPACCRRRRADATAQPTGGDGRRRPPARPSLAYRNVTTPGPFAVMSTTDQPAAASAEGPPPARIAVIGAAWWSQGWHLPQLQRNPVSA
jgi:hypothetical protein